MDKTAWLKERQKGIGGSDVAAALGLSRYRTSRDVFFDKTSPEPIITPDNPKMRAGRMLEDVIANYYAEDTGHKVIKSNKILVHKQHPFLLANVDRFILPLNGEGKGILECKTSSSFAYEHWENEVPQEYYLQIQHYFNVTGLKWGAFGILLNGWDFRIFDVKRDDELIEMITERLVSFWNNHILTGIAPEPSTKEEIISIYPNSIPDKSTYATSDIIKLVNELKVVKSSIADLEVQKEVIENKIQLEMKDAETLIDTDNNILCTWKVSKESSKFNEKIFAQENNELYQKYLITKQGSRRFLLNNKIKG